MAARRSLLESDAEEDDSSAPTLKINQAYARRLEYNKKREDLHRLQELQKKGLADSDDSEDDEDEDEDGVLPQRTEVQIFETLARIKNKDPSIYNSEVKFFKEEDDEDDAADGNAAALQEKKRKAVYLKDVVAQQALEGGVQDDEDEDDGVPKRRNFKTYAEEQQELKDEFLKGVAVAADEDEEGLFKVRKKSKEQDIEPEKGDVKKEVIARRLDEYFGKGEELDESAKFLKDYLLNQGWIDKEKNNLPSYEDIVGEVIEEEAEIEKQEDYEARFNFRFEEGAGSQVFGHSRVVENSVRKLPEKRKEQRKKKQERVSEAEFARQEEVKRLKNVKKKEILEKMAKIQTVAGVESMENLNENDLEEDFDPAEYDKKMQDVFGEEYYNKHDPDFQTGDDDEDEDGEGDLSKPDFDAEDEALGLPQGWDGGRAEGFAAVHDKQKATIDQSGETEMLKEEIEKKLEEYYKLDYEDVVGGLPTRFKYTQVKANKFGLTAAQVLGAEDSELNQYVSLKALAPYRSEEWIPRHKHQRLTKKERKRRALDQVPSLENAKSKKQKREEEANAQSVKNSEEQKAPGGKAQEAAKDDFVKESKSGTVKTQERKREDVEANVEAAAAQEDDHNTEDQGSRKKRKRRKQGLNMSHNRLLSYGKIDLPKKKRK